MKAKLTAVIVILFSSTAFSQTASELETKFGKPIQVYSLTEHIWMTADFTSNGQVCQMKLFPKRVGPNTDYLTQSLPFEEVKFILNRLVPPTGRGTKGELFGYTDTGGGVGWTTYSYEKATFVFTFPIRVDRETLKQAESHSFSAEEMSSYRKPAKTPPADNDFDNSQNAKLEIVTINWTGRKCAAQ